MTTNFKITWPSGLVTVEDSEASTVDGYAMLRWGANSYADMASFNVQLEVTTDPLLSETVALKALAIQQAKDAVAAGS